MIEMIFFLFGICFGSFVNVLVDRIPHGKTVLIDRSKCDFCKHPLSFFDLIPIISYIFLQGKCRYCHHILSLQYPIVECLTGITFVILYLFLSPTTPLQMRTYILYAILFGVGYALILMDIKYHLLPDKLLIPFGAISFFLILITDMQSLLFRLFVGIVSCLPLLFLFLFSKGKGMGFGDVKLIGILGFLLSFPEIFVAYYLAFLTGAVYGVILILLRRKKLKGSTIAFGPFLFLGSLGAAIWGSFLWHYLLAYIGW